MTAKPVCAVLSASFWLRGTSTFRLALILSALIHFCIIFVIYGKITQAILGVYQPNLTPADNYLDVELISENDLTSKLAARADRTPTPIPK